MRFIFVYVLLVLSVHSAPNVLVTIPPIHSLVSGIMDGVSEPDLLISGAESPHHFVLKPSHIKKILHADLIIWIGGDLETFLIKSLLNNAKPSLELLSLSGLNIKALRYGCEHHHGIYKTVQTDPHIWLDLDNAVTIVQEVRSRLCQLDPPNCNRYKQNARIMINQIQEIIQDFNVSAPRPQSHYITFHDAFQYFEKYTAFQNVGVIAKNNHSHDSAGISLKQLNNINEIIQKQAVCCIFSEPQNITTLVRKLANDHKLCLGELDPLGANLKPGPSLFLDMIKKLYQTFSTCQKQDILHDLS